MANLNGILDKLLSSNVGTGMASGLAGGMSGSLLMSKKGRKFGKSALKVGGVAAVGALAYSAYKKYADKQNTPSADIPSHAQTSEPLQLNNTGFIPDDDDQLALEDLETVLVTAMIAASRADGQMDVKESQEIFKQIKAYNLPTEKETLLMQQIENPVDMDALIKAAKTPEIAAEIYTISVITMDEINTAERDYLMMLAMRLKLPAELTDAIEREVNQQTLTDAA